MSLTRYADVSLLRKSTYSTYYFKYVYHAKNCPLVFGFSKCVINDITHGKFFEWEDGKIRVLEDFPGRSSKCSENSNWFSEKT